jgi:hypothetical protein
VFQIDTNSRIGISAGFGAVLNFGLNREAPDRWNVTRHSM